MSLDKLLTNQRFVIASNRLPFAIEKGEDSLSLIPTTGGLVTSLEPLLKKNRGMWIGWPGITGLSDESVKDLAKGYSEKSGYTLQPVNLTEKEISLYYKGFSNELLWPLFHDLQTECHFDPSYWEMYRKVNKKFARQIISNVGKDDFIWIHDYHLMMVGSHLRSLSSELKSSFFHHIPFAPLDIFLKIPWRFELLRGLLQYDFIGFQTMRDKRNFIHCVKTLLKDVSIESYESHEICTIEGREVYIAAFPVGIDFSEFSSLAESTVTKKRASQLRHNLDRAKIVFSVDRLDYTKGILQRLDGIERFLEKYKKMHGEVIFVQLIVPSRTHIREYTKLKEQIDRKVSAINGRYTVPGWVPIHYMFYPLSREELVSYYSAADVMLVTPVKDGMNLVVKEYIASNTEETGSVILSEFAGAAAQLNEQCQLINPYDIEGVADALNKALTASLEERKRAMHEMRRIVESEDIYSWITSIYLATYSNKEKEFPSTEEYIPREKVS